jgi:2-keto-4-pentenoate hydratase
MSNSSIFQNPKSGSIKATGTYDVVDEFGNVIKTVVDPKFCGCGLSQDKPFCDKSHASYVSIVTRMLEDARKTVASIMPVGVWGKRAFEIRKRLLENRLAAGEVLIGIKFGGALIKSESEEKKYEGIFGFLTDAMRVKEKLDLNSLIVPMAEAEIVFKLSKDLDREISLNEVLEYVGQVAPGIEIFDSRYGAIEAFLDDVIADNASSGAFIYGNWIDAKKANFEEAEISIFVNDIIDQQAPANSISGNPWLAVVKASKKLREAGVTLPAGTIIFSGSATKGIAMQPGKYRVEITGIGEVALEAIN